MDIRLDVNPALRSALLKSQTATWAAKKQESKSSLSNSWDTLELSEEAIAACTSEMSRKTTTEAEPAFKTFAEQWRAERGKYGILWTEDGHWDDSETTFWHPIDGDVAFQKYLNARGKSCVGMYKSDLDIASCQIVRDQISQSVQELLQKNGVTIPEGQSFTMKVSGDLYIHAVGLDDPELTEAVEGAINVGNNGYYLQCHISECSRVSQELGLTVPSASDSLSKAKESLFMMVQDLSGYDIRELDRHDGNIYTPDGQNLLDVLLKKAANYETPNGMVSIDISQYWLLYNRIAQLGWDCVADPVYELLYMDGSLYDIGTEYGYGPGQTDWQEWAHANAAALSANAIVGIDQQIAENEARIASQTRTASAPARAARVAESPKEPEESEKPADPEGPGEPEKPDPETWTGPWTLPLFGEREPLVLPKETLQLADGKLLQPISNKDRYKFRYGR